jgi:hypothetical protein
MKPPRLVVASFLVIAACRAAIAGGPHAVNGAGQPMAWSTAGAVTYNPESGPLGQLTNAQARALLAEAFAEWQAGPATITFTEGSLLGVDVNATGTAATNPAHYQNFYRKSGDARSPVIFDSDGSIIDGIFGTGARFDILGVAGLDTPVGVTTTITEASIVINGAFYDGIGLPSSPDDVSLIALKAAMVHEIGHFINLDHTDHNHELAFDGNAGNDIYVPTMFPVTVDDEEALASTNPDDQLAAENLYPPGAPANGFAGSVTTSGAVPFQGASVVFRKTDDPLMTSYSIISGNRFFPCNAGSSCNPCTTACDPGNPAAQGSFAADFFIPGSYKICVEQIDRRFTAQSGTFVGPLATPSLLTGPEECFDAAESGTSADDPDDFQAVAAGSGTPINIVLDSLPAADAFEPNNSFGTASVLADLPAGSDTAPAVLGAGDLDVYQVPVVAGQRVRIDIDAKELGSSLDAVVGFYNASNTLVAVVDDAVDPDTGEFSLDPAIELTATFTGTAKVVVSSYPDLDQDGVGGGTTGGYWLRVAVATDTDGDGVPDSEDICPATAKDDADRDGVCFGVDNCPTDYNPGQDAPIRLLGNWLPATGDVTAFAITPNDARVIFLADRDNDDVVELYSVSMSGDTAPIKLNTPLGNTSKDVTAFMISPDGTRIVYLADQDSDDVFELYVTDLFGSSVTKLSGSMVSGGDVLEFNISPDSTRVVYRADQNIDGVGELYSVPIGGPAASGVNLSGTLVSGGSVVDPPPGLTSFLISGFGLTVVFEADKDVDEQYELYSVPIAGPAANGVKLNGTIVPAGGDVGNFRLDGIDQRVVYGADQDLDGVVELYSVPIAGPASSAVKLNTALPAGRAGLQRFLISIDGSTVVYTMDQQTATVFELWSVFINGGTSPTNLSGALVSGGDVFGIAVPVGGGDGDRMSFRADKEVDGRTEIFSVPIGGPNTSCVKLNNTPVAGGQVTAQGGGIYKSRVIYIADQDTDEKFEIYSVPADRSTPPVKVSGTMQASGDVVNASFDEERIAVYADKDTDNVNELYGARLTGGLPVKLNGPLPPGGSVTDWNTTVATHPGAVVYLADQDTVGKFELYARTFSIDSEGDGVFDRCDLCPDASDASQADVDGDGAGDACQPCTVGTDLDEDGICGVADNCPAVPNAGQEDFDLDGAGDACDVDDDNDGLLDTVETNTGTYVGPGDTGSNPFDSDSDNDGVSDGAEVAGGTNPNSPASASIGVPFHAGRVITSTADGADSVYAADVDDDGDLDVLSASQYDGKIAWYENNGASPPVWTAHTISTAADGAHSVFAADVDGDGDMDVLSASSLDNKIAWYENNGASPPSWTVRTISTAAANAMSVFAADVDGDGDIDALSASFDDNKIAWYENDGASPPNWTARTITTSANGAQSVFAADVDGDGDIDVLSASAIDNKIAWYENNGASPPTWTARTISTAAASALSVFAADVDGDGDIDALSASFLDDKIAWYENNGASPPVWTARTISTSAVEAYSVFAADVDGDGDTDVLAASYLDGTAWYENDGASPPVWTARTISTSVGVFSVIAADVDDDGDLDALSATLDDNKITAYENETIHRNAAFKFKRLISSSVGGVVSVDAGDIDGDGDVDTLHAAGSGDTIKWFANNGAKIPGWVAHTLAVTPAGLEQAELYDLDQDGDLDVLAAAGGADTIVWYENNGAAVPSFTVHTVSTSQDGPLFVTAADLDGDGDPDLVASSSVDNKLVWYRNDGGAPLAFTEFVISSTGPNERGLATADMDHDGDIDIVAAVPNLGRVVWFRNDGGATPTFTKATLSNPDIGVTNFVDIADINGDGDLDVVSASYNGFDVAWFENDGAANPTWTTHSIVTPVTLWGPAAAKDMDRDGDIDIVASAASNGFYWFENDGNDPPAWTIRTIANDGSSVGAFAPADLNGDGDLDLAVGEFSSGFGHRFLWWDNLGGQLSLAGTSLASATIGNGAVVPVLAFDFASNARPGDSDIELATLELTITDGSLLSLSTDEANRLIQRVRVYLDNGSSVFEQGSDTLVATVEDLTLAPLSIPFAKGDPRVRFAPGQSKRLFVVIETTLDASSQSPNTLKLSGAGSSARNATTAAPVELQFIGGGAVTPTMTVIGDLIPPFVTSVFPTAGSVDVVANTNVVVFMSEPVNAATAAAGVSLELAGAKVPGAVRVSSDGRVVTFDPSATLALGGTFQFKVTSALKDRSGNGATPFTSSLETAASAGSGVIEASDLGEASGGSLLEGANANDNSGFSAAALEDVNATTLSQGISDLIVGAPNADAGAVDAGEARLVFGAPGLQSNAGTIVGVTYRTGVAGDFLGDTVAPAGDMNHDGIKDFLIGAPRSDQSGSDAGAVYLVFGNPGIDELAPGPLNLGNLAACASPTLCGVKFRGASSGDSAGASISRAGDVNADGFDDILIGAPGADPAGRADAGVVYLIFGPLAPGTISLSSVGTTKPGLVLRGETAGDHLGASVSQWEDRNSDGIDDMLLGAPGATSLDELGAPIPTAGYVYAVHGGRQPGHLVDSATPGIIELSRVANGAADQVSGMVFLGATPNGALGRSLTGAVDTDGNGVDDILIAGNGVVFAIPGDGPKTVDGGTRTGTTIAPPPLSRTFGGLDAIRDFGAARYVAPDSDPLTVGAAGDLDHDGFEDFIIGAPLADGAAGIDAGRAYVVLGSPAPAQAERSLTDVGGSIAGFIVEGAEAGDNLGASVGGGQDVNADGVADGLVGAPFADTGAGTPANAGATYVLSPLHPDDVQQLHVQIVGGATRLEWSVPDLAAGYNVYSGLLSTLRSNAGVRTSSMTHLACGTNIDADADLLPDYDDATADPAVGEAFVYLVTARNVRGEGPLGSGAPTRSNDAQCP